MRLKKYVLLAMFLVFVQNIDAQIKNLDDLMIKTEELRMLTQRVAKNYIMNGILPNNEKISKKLTTDIESFDEKLVNLTENAPNEDIEIELQKLSLSWYLMSKIIKKDYDASNANKIINYSEKLQNEIQGISDMISKSTKLKSVKLLKISSNGRMLSQKMLLYYIAAKIKLRNKDVPARFEKAKADLYDVIKLLTEQSVKDPDLKADEGIAMYMDMIKDSYDKVRKNINLKAHVHPKTANMIVNQMTNNFDLLTDLLYEKFN